MKRGVRTRTEKIGSKYGNTDVEKIVKKIICDRNFCSLASVYAIINPTTIIDYRFYTAESRYNSNIPR